MKKAKKQLNTILLIFVFIISIFSITVFANNTTKTAYAVEQNLGEKTISTLNPNYGDLSYPKNISMTIKRTSKNKYSLTGSFTWQGNANPTDHYYYIKYNGKNIVSSSEGGMWWSDVKKTFSATFESNDTESIKLTFGFQNSYGSHTTANSKTVEWTAYDNINPSITLNDVANGGTTKKSFSVTATDKNNRNTSSVYSLYAKTPNDSTFVKQTSKTFAVTKSSIAGKYEFYAEDESGNKSLTYFVNYTTPTPTGTLSGVTNGGITNKDVRFTWNNSNDIKVELNGNIIQTGTNSITISNSQRHTIVITDTAMFNSNNSTTYTFRIDKLAPTGSFNIAQADGFITKQDVRFRWDDEEATATLNGQPYQSGNLISSEGNYTIILKDFAGNSNTYTFTIDKTAPTGTLNGVENGGITNKDVTFTWSDEEATATLNNELYNKNELISVAENREKPFNIVLTDKAGNSTTYKFTINKVLPVGKLIGVENSGFTNTSVRFTWSDEETTATLNGQPYKSGTNIENENTYTIILTNKYNNSSTYTFTIDRTAPTGTLIGVTNGGITNKDVRFTWSDVNATAKLNDAPYSSNMVIDNENRHIIVLTDKAGNSTTYTFTIDKTAPTGTLNGVENGGVTNKNVTFTWLDSSATATLNGQRYNNNEKIDIDNNTRKQFTLVLTDRAGNSTTYSFTIYKILPTIIFKNSAGNNLGLQPNETFYYNNTVQLEFDPSFTLVVNDLGQTSNIITAKPNTTEKYNIVIKDKLGNANTYLLVLDTQAPNENYLAITSQGKNHINRWWETFDYELKDTQYLQKNMYSFASYEQARSFAISREEQIREYGIYQGGSIYCNYAKTYVNADENLATNIGNPYYIYKSLANPNTLIAYFNITSLNEAINKYTSQSIREKYIPSKPANAYENEPVFNSTIFFGQQNFTLPNNYDNKYTLVINGQQVSYSFVLSEGVNNIAETDKAGNTTRYTILLDNTAPNVVITDCAGNGSSIGSPIEWIENLQKSFMQQTEIRFDKSFRLSVADALDENAIMKITLNGETQIFFMENALNYYNFLQSGRYEIEWYDKIGNKKTVTLLLSLDAPTGTIVENKNSLDKIQSFDYVLDKVLSFNSITNIEVWYSETGVDDSYKLLSNSTSPSFTFVKDQMKYNFVVNGYYKFVIYDNFGRIIKSDKPYLLQKDKPIGNFVGKNNTFIANNSVINYGFKFTWREPASCKVNGNVYENVYETPYFYAENHYVIELTDKGSNTSIYEITIDITPTVYTLTNVKANGRTNKDVTLSWDNDNEPNVLAYVKDEDGVYQQFNNGNIFSKEKKYEIKLIDRAGNISEFTFTIDKTPPTINIVTTNGKILPQNSFTNQSIKFTWGSEQVTAWVNGVEYVADEIITKDGVYNFTLQDRLGNRAYSKITIDKTLHDGVLNGVTNDGITNKDVSFSWPDEDAQATLNGEPYEKNTIISIKDGTEQVYELILKDKANNQLVYNFTISKVKPIIELIGVTNKGTTNKTVYASWSSIYYTAILNGQPYTSYNKIVDENNYTLIVTDTRTGNNITYTFAIDKTAPTGTLDGVENGGITNNTVTFTWDEVGATATLNGQPYDKGTPIFQENIYSIYLYDHVKNRSIEYTFTIDKTAPTGTLNGVENEGTTNSSVKFSWFEFSATATLNGQPYEQNLLISNNGYYTIVLTDKAGNSTTYKFVIDKSKPYAKFLDEKDNYLQINNYIFNCNVKIVFENDIKATLDNNPFESNSLLQDEKTYTLILINTLGTKTTYTFTIDKTAPTGTLSGVTNGGITNKDVRFKWSENSATATLNGQPYEYNTLITDESQHTIVLTDKAGNSTTYSFTIYKILPDGTLQGVDDGGITNTDVTFVFEDIFTVLLNGEPYTSNTAITEDGEYTIVIKNILNIEKVYTFTIDKTAPIITLTNKNSSTISGTHTVYPFYVNVNEENVKITLNDQPYVFGNFITENGDYTIIATDRAGNTSNIFISLNSKLPEGIFSSELDNNNTTGFDLYFYFSNDCEATLNGEPYTSDILIECEVNEIKHFTIVLKDKVYGSTQIYEFIIDKTAPTGTLSGVTNGGVTNSNVKFNWDNYNWFAMLDNEPYQAGTTIRGVDNTQIKHTLVLYNQYNIQTEYTFTIDKIAPIGTLNGVENGGTTNKTITFTWDEVGATATLNGKPYENGDEITPLENSLKKYTITLTDNVGNVTTYIFYLNTQIPELNNKIPNGILQNDLAISFDDKYTATLNSEPIENGFIIDKTGDYILVLTDKYGNTNTYTFTIDKTVFELNLTVDNESFILQYNSYSNTSAVTLNSNCIITVNGNVVENNYVLNKVGTYNVVLTSEKGLTKEYTITINEVNDQKNLLNILFIVIIVIVLLIVIIGTTVYTIKITKKNKKHVI